MMALTMQYAVRVENQQSKELRGVTVAIDNGIEECAKSGDSVLRARNFAVYEIKEPRSYDDQAGVKEHPSLVLAGSVTEKESGPRIDDQSHEREHVGIDLGQRQPTYNP